MRASASASSGHAHRQPWQDWQPFSNRQSRWAVVSMPSASTFRPRTDNHARNTAVQSVDGKISMTVLFDFVPMYLDPVGITRSARWYHTQPNKELRHWQDILAHFALSEPVGVLRPSLTEGVREMRRLRA